MVRKTSQIRTGPRFHELRRSLKPNLERVTGRKISDRQFTDGMADFIRAEGLDTILLRRTVYEHKKRRKGGFF